MSASTATEKEQRTAPAPPSRTRSGLREGRAAWVLALPFCLLFLLFTVWPVIQSLFMSVTDTTSRDLRTPFAVDLVGVENYARALGDDKFLTSMANTGFFVVIGVPLTLAVALATAVALDKGIQRLRAFFRLGFYLPVITSIIAVAVVWRFIYQTDGGLLNTALGWFGVDGPNWLGSETWSKPAVLLMIVWRNFGTGMIIFLAGLQSVPASLLEAAAIDGANAWKRFWHITFPLLRPTLLFVSVTTMIGYLQIFEEPFVLTSGGPLDSTLTMSMYTYQQFSFGNYGYAASMSYLIFVVIAVVTAIQFRLLRENQS